MPEQLDLTTPIVETKTTDIYSITMIMMSTEMVGVPPFDPANPPIIPVPSLPPGIVTISIKDNNGLTTTKQFAGTLAQDMIKFINTGDFSTRSLHRRILELLSSSGVLPGAVVGTPEVPSAPTGLE